MNVEPQEAMTDRAMEPRGKRKLRVLKWVVASVLLVAITLALMFLLRWEHFKHNAEGILRARIIETLETRFNCRAELDDFHLSVGYGIGVNGGGLRLYAKDPEAAGEDAASSAKTPLIAVDSFSFRTDWQELRKKPLHVAHVYLDGFHINFPPKVEGQPRFPLKAQNQPPPDPYQKHSGISIVVDELDCTHATLIFGTNKPGKLPLDFEISKLTLERIGGGQPLRFQASLVNPRPVGLIESNGNFGPWNQQNPRETPLSGVYQFDHADLGTFKGIGGILNSTGNFAGVLNNITVDGQTDTPDFRITLSGHPVALHTEFHAVVNGTNGNTYLQPVNATFLHTHLIAAGEVVRVPDPHVPGQNGHLIQLDVTVDRGRIEDLLQLGVKTDPPVMDGAVQLKTKFDLPPGHDISVTDRLKLNGTFTVTNGHFESDKIQKKIDELSKLGQGITKDSAAPPPENVASSIDGHFTLGASKLTLSDMDYMVPGAHITVDGVYSLDGNLFDFHGIARLNAKLSQMTTGWKSLLLKPVDPFFAKHGAGTEVPFKVTGTKSEPKFGLDFGHKENPPETPEKPAQESR